MSLVFKHPPDIPFEVFGTPKGAARGSRFPHRIIWNGPALTSNHLGMTRSQIESVALYIGVSKNSGKTPKWMVKIMENPMYKWMIWGENSLSLERSI